MLDRVGVVYCVDQKEQAEICVDIMVQQRDLLDLILKLEDLFKERDSLTISIDAFAVCVQDESRCLVRLLPVSSDLKC